MKLNNVMDYAIEYVNEHEKCDISIYTYISDYPAEEFAKLPYFLGGITFYKDKILKWTGMQEELEWRLEIRNIKYYTNGEFESSEYNLNKDSFENKNELIQLIILVELVSRDELDVNLKQKGLYYVYLKYGSKFILYNPGHIGEEGYYLTDNIDKAFYFGFKPSFKQIQNICKQLNISVNDIEIIPDEHYETGLSNSRGIVYKRKQW